MSGYWDDLFPLAFVVGVISGGAIYVLLKRRLYARLEPRQRVRIGGIGLGTSGVVFGLLPGLRPDLPASFACAAFLWGMSGLFFMLLSLSEKPMPSELGPWHRLVAPRVETQGTKKPTAQGTEEAEP